MESVTTITEARAAREIPGRWRFVRQVPPSLAALLGIVLIIGLTWALLVPPFQAPDEPAHFAYAQSLAERFALPGNPRRPPESTDELLADAAAQASVEAFNPQTVKPGAWSPARYRQYLQTVRSPDRTNTGGPNPASANPPLYYLYADLAYWASYSGDAYDRLYSMRIWGVLLLMLTTTAGWLLAGEVFGRRRIPQLACAALTGLVPLESFISTSVNPDALMVALWTFALWLGARVLRRGGTQRDCLALCAVTAAAILTKATSYALVPGVVLVLLLAYLHTPKQGRREARKRLGVALLALVVPVVGWLATSWALARPATNAIPSGAHGFQIRQFLSYLWQYYLPRLSFEHPFRAMPYPLYYIWVREGWGIFGWLDVPMANWVYVVLASLSALVIGASAALLARLRDRVRLELLAYFTFVLVALLGLLHITDYQEIINSGTTLMQGRYLLPVVGLFGLCLGFVVSRLPSSWRGPACGAAVAGLLVLQVLALGTVARMYYT